MKRDQHLKEVTGVIQDVRDYRVEEVRKLSVPELIMLIFIVYRIVIANRYSWSNRNSNLLVSFPRSQTVYTKPDVEAMLEGLQDEISLNVEKELAFVAHSNALLLRLLFKQVVCLLLKYMRIRNSMNL